jgi:hypothetical protein
MPHGPVPNLIRRPTLRDVMLSEARSIIERAYDKLFIRDRRVPTLAEVGIGATHISWRSQTVCCSPHLIREVADDR